MISTSTASELTGKSKTTIKRWAKSTWDHEPEHRVFIKREMTPSGFRYLIDETFLLSKFPELNIYIEKPLKTNREGNIEPISLEVLKEQLAEKNKSLEQKDTIIQQQNLFIQSLLSKLK